MSDSDQYKAFEHQVAGSHSNISSQLLRGQFGRLLKPYKLIPNWNLLARPRELSGGNKEDVIENDSSYEIEDAYENEKRFYEACISTPDFSVLKSFIPQYFGDKEVMVEGQMTPHIVLEDLTVNCKYPCVADIKMGTTSMYPGCDLIKIEKNAKKYESRLKLGWCIAGIQQYSAKGEIIKKFGPTVGRDLTTEQTKDYYKSFVTMQGNDTRELIECFIGKLEDILAWFKNQRLVCFRGSSILFAYNAEFYQRKFLSIDVNRETNVRKSEESSLDSTSSGKFDGSKTKINLRATVKMIDFAHVLKTNNEMDSGYILGLENLVNLLRDSLDKCKVNTK